MNSNIINLLIKALIIAVLINLTLPPLLKYFATPEQIKPPNGAANLSFFNQLMHMFVHHAQVPLTSSIIIIVIVSLSISLGDIIPIDIIKK